MAANVQPQAMQSYLAPATTFNGDLLLSAYSPTGDLHVLLGDFTGHGLAATIGALPAAETFRTMTAKGFTPPNILAEINRKLRVLLPSGRFLAAVFLRVDWGMNRVTVINCGMPEAWLFSDGTAQAMFRSKAFPLGVADEDDYVAAQAVLPVSRGDCVLLVSDGAFEATNASGEIFGAHRLRLAIEEGLTAGEPLAAAVRAIDAFRGEVPLADDLSLVAVHLVDGLIPPRGAASSAAKPVAGLGVLDTDPAVGGAGWRVMLELRGHALRETGPVPLLMSLLREFPGPASKSPVLFTALAELYNNALDHGVLKLDSRLKAVDFGVFLHEREMRLAQPGDGCVTMSIDCTYAGLAGRLEMRVEDSGSGFDPATVPVAAPHALYGRGIGLVRSICESLEYEGAGNRARAVYVWQAGAEEETKA
jgi:anti-sigma regulatory factor (Ser/Thr protein kinase)